MLGNDIVDLELAKLESNWRRKNYLSKIFSAEEQEMIYSASSPDLVVWLMWSMKEAAYKIVNRKTGLRFYDPLAFRCSFSFNGRNASGYITYQGSCFSSTTAIEKGFLHTIALSQGVSFQDVEVIDLYNQPSYLAKFNKSQLHLRLLKNDSKLPEIVKLDEQTLHSASISHHGSKLSIAYLKSSIS